MITKYEYKILTGPSTLDALNNAGQEGWMVIDRVYGICLLMREVK